jgi:hypothetical protein
VEVRDRRKAAGLFGKPSLDDLPPLEEGETDGEIANAEAQLRERKYLEARQALAGWALEEELRDHVPGFAPPFERYVFTRGQPGSPRDGADRSVGVFKGCVRVCEFDPSVPGSAAAFLRKQIADAAARARSGLDGEAKSDGEGDEEGEGDDDDPAAVAAKAVAKAARAEAALVVFDVEKASAACVQDLYADFQLLGEPKNYKARVA